MALRKDIVTGALLHDIGKLIFRSLAKDDDRRKLRHQELGALWAQGAGLSQNVVEIIRRHHLLKEDDAQYGELAPEALPGKNYNLQNSLYLVAQANNIATGMEGLGVGGEDDLEPDRLLSPVFKGVALPHREPVKEDLVWEPRPAVDYNYPRVGGKGTVDFTNLYKGLWQGLRGELAQDPRGVAEDTLLLLLQKYTLYVPGNSCALGGAPDISLYHHLKTTAALAWCTYKYLQEDGASWAGEDLREKIEDEEEERYLLLGGDLSGIQDFIYTLSSKGALKTVRGRSFYLELLLEALVTRLVTELDLPRACIIYASGGGLYLLVPNTLRTREKITAVQRQVNSWLYQCFGTTLYLSLAMEPLAAAGLAGGLGKTWHMVGQKLSIAKERKWLREIEEDYASIFAPETAEESCPICQERGKELIPYPGEDDLLVCPFCAQMFSLGQLLPEVKEFYRLPKSGQATNKGDGLLLDLMGVPFLFTRGNYSGPMAGYYLLDTPWVLSKPVSVAAGNFPSGSYFTCKEFDGLVENSIGAEKLGVLRLDVDRLGSVFSRGLLEDKFSFARLNDLSERLNLYFKYYLPAFLAEEIKDPLLLVHQGRKMWLNLVYAGGDDLFLLGAWNDALEAAYQIHGDFRRYTGHNPSLTLSGGLTVADEKIPLYRLAEMAGQGEQKAKDNGRDSFAFSHWAFKWDKVGGREVTTGGCSTLKDFYTLFLRGAHYGEKGRIRPLAYSKSFLHNLAHLAAAYARGENGERAWLIPRLHYLFTRSEERNRSYRDSFYRPLLGAAMNGENLSYYLPAVLRVIDLITRGGGEG